jgi:hypothetical protein
MVARKNNKGLGIPYVEVYYGFFRGYKDVVYFSTKYFSNDPESLLYEDFCLVSVISLVCIDETSYTCIPKLIEAKVRSKIERLTLHPRQSSNDVMLIGGETLMVVQESFRLFGDWDLDEKSSGYQRLIDNRTKALSIVSNDFSPTILRGGELKDSILTNRHIKSAIALFEVTHRGQLQQINRLYQVKERFIPALPKYDYHVEYPLGVFVLKPNEIVGLQNLTAQLILFSGTNWTMYKNLQYFVYSLLEHSLSPLQIVVLDTLNELGGIIEGLKRKPLSQEVNLRIFQPGVNFYVNICDVDMPPNMGKEAQRAFQVKTIAYNLANASENYDVRRNISLLFDSITKSLENMEESKEQSLKDFTLFDVAGYLDGAQTGVTDLTVSDRLKAELRQYKHCQEMTYMNFKDHYDDLIVGDGLTIFQFPDPTQDHSMKKVFLGFLLQKVAARCTENTVIIITNAEVLFPAEGRNREQLNPVYETAIGQYAQKIKNKGTLVLSTKSPLKMREDICNAYDIGLFYYLSNPSDRQWLANRQALGPRQSELNQLLATLHQEGLMFREDLVFHFVPHLLEPIDLEVTVPQESVRPASVGRLSDTEFSALMITLQQLKHGPVEIYSIFDYLAINDIENAEGIWKKLRLLPYTETQKYDEETVLVLTDTGNSYYDDYIHEIEAFPSKPTPPQLIDSLGKNPKNPESLIQMNKEAIEAAGAVLNELYQLEGRIDWKLFRLYLKLKDASGVSFEDHLTRIQLLQRIYKNCKIRIKKHSEEEDFFGNEYEIVPTSVSQVEDETRSNLSESSDEDYQDESR